MLLSKQVVPTDGKLRVPQNETIRRKLSGSAEVYKCIYLCVCLSTFINIDMAPISGET